MLIGFELYGSLGARVSGWRLVCSVVTIVFDEVRTEILCIHTKLIIVFIVVYVCRVYCERKNSKDALCRSIMISFEKSVST